MAHDTSYSPKIIQVGRSDFVSSVLRGLSVPMTVVSSKSDPSASLKEIKEGMIVFVPPKIPDAVGDERFQSWFSYTKKNIPKSVHISLISSLICDSDSSVGARYDEYRAAKQTIESNFICELQGINLDHEISIIRLGMFMPTLFPSRAQAIKLLAHTLRPFAPICSVYRYTDKIALRDTLSQILRRQCNDGIIQSCKTVEGTGLFSTPKILAPLVKKIYTQPECAKMHSVIEAG